ncbi:syntaxin-2-like isoform X2 [Echeneis naucrates]|uniref:syntaxin-2-like isoform X2 n=1 Tax=Echeneis naucrates TaxID=173247 RepID=UPI0011144C80|nr:syntaxin-2-like isoform X2 [Echeneis naucrates]
MTFIFEKYFLGNEDKLELLNSEIKKNANLVRAKLKSMQKNLPVEERCESFSVIQRIQRNQHSHLTRWFAEVMRGHHNVQISFREKCKAQIRRQLEIVNKVTTDEELEEMLHHDNLTIFISDLNSDAHISTKALSEIESRHQDIICLESSIKELHEIFADTAMLLQIQGELINNIEKNVTSAAEYVLVSKEETKKAVMYKKNSYKIASMPGFFKPFKRQTAAKTTTDHNTSDLNHD